MDSVSKSVGKLLNKLIKKILRRSEIDEEELRAILARNYPVVRSILANLNCSDLKSCSRVCRSWNRIATNVMKEKILYNTSSERMPEGKFLALKEAVEMLETHSIQLILIFEVNKITIYNYLDNTENTKTSVTSKVRLNGVSYSKNIVESRFRLTKNEKSAISDLPASSVIAFPVLSGLKIIPLSVSRKDWQKFKKSGLDIFQYLDIPVRDLKCLLFFVNAGMMTRMHRKMSLSYTMDCAVGGGVIIDPASEFLGIAFCGPKVHAYSFGWKTNKKYSKWLIRKPSGINASNCVGMIFLNTFTLDWKCSERDLTEFVHKEFPDIHFSIFYETYSFLPWIIRPELEELKLKYWFALVTLIWID